MSEMEPGDIFKVIEAVYLNRGGRSRNTANWFRQKQMHFAIFLRDHGRPTKMDKIRKSDVSAFMQHLDEERGRSDQTIRGYWLALDQLFRYYFELPPARKAGWGEAPAALKGLRPPPCAKVGDNEALTDDEVRRLMDVVQDPRDYALLTLMLATGIRAGEAVNVEVDDVDLERERLMIRRAGYRSPGKTKTGAARPILLARPALATLSDYLVRVRPKIVPEGTRHLFAKKNGTPLKPGGVYRLVRKYVEKAGLKTRQKGCHLLRRTYASQLRAAGVSKGDLAVLLGHSEKSGTRVVDESYLASEANEEAIARTKDQAAEAFEELLPVHRRRGQRK